MFIALELVEDSQALRAITVGPADTVERALSLASDAIIDGAIIVSVLATACLCRSPTGCANAASHRRKCCKPWRWIMGHPAPGHPCLPDRTQAVENLANAVFALASILGQQRQIRRQQRPFFIARV